MKCLFAALVLILIGGPAFASPITDPAQIHGQFTLIDFEQVETGGNLLTGLSNPATFGAVTFSSLTGSLSILDISASGQWAADGTEIASKTLFAGGEPDSAIRISFAAPVSQFLLGWGDPNFAGNVLQAYDQHGNLLEQAAVALGPPGGTHAAWIGFSRHRADIASILVQPNQTYPSGDDYVIDNIYYSMRPPDRVPEPSSLMLMSVGVGLILFSVKKRKAAMAVPARRC